MPKSTPSLPLELEREIAWVTAFSYPWMLPTLMLTARRFSKWLEPLLYHVVPVDHSPAAYAFMRAAESKPPTFLRHAVRHVYLDSCWEEAHVAKALKMCTGVQDLAVTANYTETPLLSILCGMQLRRFSGFLVSVFGSPQSINVHHSLLGRLTHLDLYDDPIPTELFRLLPALPSLTHLALNHSVHLSVLRYLLESVPALVVLIVLWDIDLRDSAVEYGVDLLKHAPTVLNEPRFVMIVYNDTRSEWEAGAWGGDNFWVRAERWSKKRRNGEMNPEACLCLDI
ncbi:F-box domain-containing protein [Mycena indigotica]|uniref:F-box domain-containing protein n=1 Tax=Mycena indigotica TaxID=2126181 RepID=A0A8H6W3V0_9AGAR|nr:F-box domain-containing protein [Mycena indigotica]KAF7303947.1 F-box domain-containing protein [Mycena indigotica]